VIRFIAEHKDNQVTGPDGGAGLVWGVEPMCAVLSEHGVPISASTYYEWINKAPTRRQLQDGELVQIITAQREDKKDRQVRANPGVAQVVDQAARSGPRRGPVHRGADHARAGVGGCPLRVQAQDHDRR
jgi:hypothetical protein